MKTDNVLTSGSSRRTFLKKGMVTASAGTLGLTLMARETAALMQEGPRPEEKSGRLTRGDAAMLRFAAAAEILETDFWVQYNELGGVPNTSEVPGGSGNPAYTALLAAIDDDMPQYIHDNTDDEFTHQNFLNAYLEAKGAAPVDLEPFRTTPISIRASFFPKPCPISTTASTPRFPALMPIPAIRIFSKPS